MIDLEERFLGVVIGGAVGDAVGAGIEFSELADIRRSFGPNGVTGPVEAYGRVGAITDDTQMTLFTLEGLIRASVRARSKGICAETAVVRHAYLRWLHTQGTPWRIAGQEFADPSMRAGPDGWLIQQAWLHSDRAPGNTCLSALHLRTFGTPTQPINGSKGCGGVMRAAPAGLVRQTADEHFRLGCEVAALTHGHPSGYLPAGVLAAMVGKLLGDATMASALDQAVELLIEWPGHQETLSAIASARQLVESGPPSPEALETLGGGWVGEEALAISLACVLDEPDFATGVLRAVNHSGDSDSTGSIAGNLLGARRGVTAIPQTWLEQLEGREDIETLTRDAFAELTGHGPSDEWGGATQAWFDRYPGW